MPSQLEPFAKDNISQLLDAGGRNPLKDLFFKDADAQLLSRQTEESLYRLFVVETAPGGQQEIHELREYTEGELSRIATRPTFRFRWKCQRLLEQAERVAGFEADSLEFEHQATLLWAEIAALSEHLGNASEVDEVIAALHVAYAQHVKRVTPKPVVEALAAVFRLVIRYTRLPTQAVDGALDVLQQAGVDLNYPMAFAKADA